MPGPWLASRVFGHDFVESFFIFAALVNLHHFILDGAIWKLRDGRIARLLLGRNPPDGAAETATAEAGGGLSLRWLFGPANPARWPCHGLGASMLAWVCWTRRNLLTLKHSGQPAPALAQLFNPEDTPCSTSSGPATHAGRPECGSDRRAPLGRGHQSPQCPAQQLLGELLFRSGDTAAALAHYDRMAELLRPDLVVLVNSGVLASNGGDLAKAQERFAAAVRLVPGKTELHLYLAEAMEKAGDVPHAMGEYELYAQLHVEDAADPANLGNRLTVGLKLGDLYTCASASPTTPPSVPPHRQSREPDRPPGRIESRGRKLRRLGLRP